MRIFVYGTLKRGEHAAFMMAECVYKGQASIEGTLYGFGHFPGVKLGGEDVVPGEVYELPADKEARERILARLDRYEGCPRLYRRVETLARLDYEEPEFDNFDSPVQTYEYVPEVREEWLIPSGVFTTIPQQERLVYEQAVQDGS